jgi:O-antigen/teichoic acid export membrane protein
LTAESRGHRPLLVSQFAAAAGSFALSIVTARALGPEGRGVFAFFLLWPNMGAFVLAAGLPGANLKLAAEREDRVPALIGNTGLLTLLTAFLLAGVLLSGAPSWLTGPMPPGLVWLACGAVVLMMCLNGLTWLMMGIGSFMLASVLKGAYPALAAVIFLLALSITGGEAATVWAAASCWLASMGLVVAYALMSLVRQRGRPVIDRGLLRTSLTFGLRYQVGVVTNLVAMRLDQWILGVVRPAADLGVYSVAASASEVAAYAASARGMTRFRDSARGDDVPPRQTIRSAFTVTAVGALLVGAISVWAIPLVFGADFGGSVPLTLLLLPGALGIGVARVCGNDLAGRGRPGLASLLSAVKALVALAGFAVLIPVAGATGAAIVSSVSYLFGAALLAVALIRVGGRVIHRTGPLERPELH